MFGGALLRARARSSAPEQRRHQQRGAADTEASRPRMGADIVVSMRLFGVHYLFLLNEATYATSGKSNARGRGGACSPAAWQPRRPPTFPDDGASLLTRRRGSKRRRRNRDGHDGQRVGRGHHRDAGCDDARDRVRAIRPLRHAAAAEVRLPLNGSESRNTINMGRGPQEQVSTNGVGREPAGHHHALQLHASSRRQADDE